MEAVSASAISRMRVAEVLRSLLKLYEGNSGSSLRTRLTRRYQTLLTPSETCPFSVPCQIGLPRSVRNTMSCGTERVSGTHPERVSGTHLGFQDGRSGQEWQLGVHSVFRSFLDFIDSRNR